LLQAVESVPEDALAWARLSELQLALGYRDRALEAAQRAVSLAPDLGRTQSVLGFAALAALDIDRARDAFSRAIQADTADPLPRLGNGLAIIRGGDLEGGRHQIEIATGLAPGDALVRSYIGKAYAEENRSQTAGEQLEIAKSLDPNDPTPFFYDALRKQSDNRPVEAIQDIGRAIELNDNRAVYRSRLLLDQDLAVRSTSLGRIYNDLGFSQLAEQQAAASLTQDPASAPAHRFLSDAYAGDPRQEVGRVSELFQARMLQPLALNPVQPRLTTAGLGTLTGISPAFAGYNEFTPLFERDRLQLTVTGLFGSDNTFGDEAVVSGLYGRLAFSAGQLHLQSDGFRPNNDLEYNIYTLFTQAALTEDLSAQIELRRRRSEIGDPRLLFNRNSFFGRSVPA
jgi:tetratricopeptide (TPR) repeat protein